jgi:hypothetical protein
MKQDCLVQLLEYLGAGETKHVKGCVGINTNTPQLRRNLERNSNAWRRFSVERKIIEPVRMSSDTMVRIIQLSSELQSPTRLNRKQLNIAGSK